MNQKKILKGTLIALAAAAFLALIAVIPSVHSAGEADLQRTAKAETRICYERYVVQQNDSLWKIAGQYAESYGVSTAQYVEVLKEMNHLHGDRIITGQSLILPFKTY